MKLRLSRLDIINSNRKEKKNLRCNVDGTKMITYNKSIQLRDENHQ